LTGGQALRGVVVTVILKKQFPLHKRPRQSIGTGVRVYAYFVIDSTLEGMLFAFQW